MITPQCGGDSEKDTPVTMPNTEVKLLSADCSEGLPLVRVGRRHANGEKQIALLHDVYHGLKGFFERCVRIVAVQCRAGI